MKVAFDRSTKSITVHVDRSRIVSDGKPALGQMLLRLHMYRCTANVTACRAYYEELSRVDGEFLEWRDAIISQQQPRRIFIQANTFLEGGKVTLKEYPTTKEGVVQSWAERLV
jgi:dipeptidyl-peptidase III